MNTLRPRRSHNRKLRLLSTSAVAVALATYAAACSDDGTGGLFGPTGDGTPSRAYGVWTPGPGDTCTAADHNRYAAVGPDGKLYPTWHPPVDPSGCTFGHEHGRDPRGSSLYRVSGPILFGYANEQLDVHDPGGMRHEDHVGHKIEWEDDVELGFNSDVADALLEIRCDVLAKLHQGTHSKDAFTNNVHELVYHVRCSEGTRFGITMLTAIGEGGEFVRRCADETHVHVGTPTPTNSPDGGGKRRLPDRSCVEQFMLVPEGERSSFGQALRESWQLSDRIRTVDGRRLVSFNPYFNVNLPSRFHDPADPDLVGRPIDVCYEVMADGRAARGGPCDDSTGEGTVAGVTYDDPRSLFNGVARDMDINNITVSNLDGPEVWYTDPYGKNARTEPFPGSIRQFIARVESPIEVGNNGPVIGRNRDYGGPGVHAPN